MGDEKHYPHVLFDGLSYRATCSCMWSGRWRSQKAHAEFEWGEHAVKTIQRTIARKSFVIVGNPLGSQGSKN